MDESGELLDILKPASTDGNAEENLDVRLNKLITSFDVMLFMKVSHHCLMESPVQNIGRPRTRSIAIFAVSFGSITFLPFITTKRCSTFVLCWRSVQVLQVSLRRLSRQGAI